MGGPLEGIRVVDCTRGMAGPRLGGFLADYGADVIWVEPPGGDPWREHLCVEYSVFARGKRSVELDLKHDSGRAALLRLVDEADVFLASWSPGVAERLGLGFDAIHDRAKHVVGCSITGFGPGESSASPRGYEALVHAKLGTMAEQVGHRDGPIFVAVPFASIGAALLGLIGTLAALYRRDQDGVGRLVETSLVDGVLAYMSMQWSDGQSKLVDVSAGASRLVTRTFLCQDENYLGVHTGAVGAFGRLMQLVGLDDRIKPSEDGLDLGLPLDPGQAELLHDELERAFASKPRDAWIELLTRADVCAVAVLAPGEVFDQPQTRHNQMVATVSDPTLGTVLQVGPPVKLRSIPDDGPTGAPSPGEHNLELSGGAPWRNPDVRRSLPVRDGQGGGRALLSGLRILDVGAYFAGPYSSRLLADLGAEVIKVEPPGGDQLRGLDVLFRSCQAGKRSLAADFKEPDLAAARTRLVEWADVIHHNMRPGAAERLGLGYDDVMRINSSAVYVHAPG